MWDHQPPKIVKKRWNWVYIFLNFLVKLHNSVIFNSIQFIYMNIYLSKVNKVKPGWLPKKEIWEIKVIHDP